MCRFQFFLPRFSFIFFTFCDVYSHFLALRMFTSWIIYFSRVIVYFLCLYFFFHQDKFFSSAILLLLLCVSFLNLRTINATPSLYRKYMVKWVKCSLGISIPLTTYYTWVRSPWTELMRWCVHLWPDTKRRGQIYRTTISNYMFINSQYLKFKIDLPKITVDVPHCIQTQDWIFVFMQGTCLESPQHI